MTTSRASTLASAIVALLWLGSLLLALYLAGATVNQVRTDGLDHVDAPTLSFIPLAGVMLAYASLGALVIRRRPGHRVGWLLLVTGPMVLAVFGGFGAGSTLTAGRGTHDLLAGVVSWVPVVLFGPAIVSAIALLPILFPDGRLPGPRWRLPFTLLVGSVAAGSLCFAVAPGQFDPGLAVNPFGIPGAPPVLPFAATILDTLAIVAGGVMGVASIAVRFRRSRADERQQVKWMLAAVTVVVLLVIPGEVGLDPGNLTSIPGAASLGLIPLAVAVAILRYRLYEIDRIISRTIAYAIVVGLLGATFAALVLGLQALLAGVTQGETVPVAVSTLAVFALFQPVRNRVRVLVDRRFNRARYDAAQTAERLAERLRDEVDLERLSDAVVATVRATLAPERAVIWVRGEPE